MNVLKQPLRLGLGLMALVGLGLAGYFLLGAGGEKAASFVTTPARTGDVVRTIVTTGTVNPVATVTVGSYVSGVIQSWTCDFNTRVTKGQKCAKIDPRPYQTILEQDTAALASAEAQVRKDRAALAYAKVDSERAQRLQKSGAVSKDTVDAARNVLDQAEAQISLGLANVAQRQASLDAAQVNLDYTDILAPVDGTVISRNIEIGQTVAASFQTPTLFLIATDLTRMQIDTNVSESDIGEAREGQTATFTVEAFPGRTFRGTVRQVRRAPISVQNVITYNVVIDVDNADQALLPGLTANVRIITAEANGALVVPAPALRFTPADGGKAKRGDEADTGTGAQVWILREGAPLAVAVETGVASTSEVAVVGDLKPGDLVITGEASSAPAPRTGGPGGPSGPRSPMPRL